MMLFRVKMAHFIQKIAAAVFYRIMIATVRIQRKPLVKLEDVYCYEGRMISIVLGDVIMRIFERIKRKARVYGCATVLLEGNEKRQVFSASTCSRGYVLKKLTVEDAVKGKEYLERFMAEKAGEERIGI